MRTASELLFPTMKPPPWLSPLLSAGHGPFSTGDGLFAHRLRLPPAGTARAEHAGTAGHTKSEGRGDRGAVCLGRRAFPWGWHRAPRSQSCRGRGHASETALAAARLPCPMEALLETEQSISLFLSWNWSIYSFHTLLR